MRITLLLLCVCLWIPHVEAAENVAELPAQSQTDIGYPTPSAALEALRIKPGVTIREENDWFILVDPSENSFWSITQPAHPAHPSAVKRTLVEKDGAVHVDMQVLCGASKSMCDRLAQLFQELNASIAKSMPQ